MCLWVGSARGCLLVTLFFCNCCLYIARTNITVAIIYMFPADDNIEGSLLSAFYVGYTLSQIPGGYIAARWGAKRVLLVAVALWSVATVSSALFGLIVPVLFLMRVIVGLSEGVNYPSQMQFISKWIPHGERSKAWAFVVSGESVGTVIALSGGPWLVHVTGDWRSVFWVSGLCSAVWLVAFALLTASEPGTHPRISQEEKDLIYSTRPPTKVVRPTPWKAICTNGRMLAVVATQCCYNFGYYMCLSWISKFFKQVYCLDYGKLGLLSVMPYFATFFCIHFSGFFADYLEMRCNFTATTVRKLGNTIGMCSAAVLFLLLAQRAPSGVTSPSYVGNSGNLSLVSPSSSSSSLTCEGDAGDAFVSAVLLACAVGIGSVAMGAGYWPTLGDLSPEFSQVLVGISNSIASIPGILSGITVGSLLASTHNNWHLVFIIAAVVEGTGALIFLLFASAEDQHFGGDGKAHKDSMTVEQIDGREDVEKYLLDVTANTTANNKQVEGLF